MIHPFIFFKYYFFLNFLLSYFLLFMITEEKIKYKTKKRELIIFKYRRRRWRRNQKVYYTCIEYSACIKQVNIGGENSSEKQYKQQ